MEQSTERGSASAATPDKTSSEELKEHAERIGADLDLIKIEDSPTPECVTVAIGKSDGRTLRRVVPLRSWREPTYRSSLIRDMALLLT